MKPYSSAIDCKRWDHTKDTCYKLHEREKVLDHRGKQGFYLEVGESYNFG